MRHLRRAAVFTLALLLLPVVGWTQDKPVRVADLPREFRGTYGSAGDPKPFAVSLKIAKVEQKGGTIHFSGSHTYQPGDYVMRVDGTIDAKTRRITMRESFPTRPESDTDGTFEGSLSTDFQAIEAVWKSNVMGTQSALKLRASKGK